MRKPVAVAATSALLAALMGLAAPADAACGVGDLTCTEVSFTVGAGTIALTASPAATGGTATISGGGATIAISLGASVVNDTRVNSTGWSVSASASDFATSGGTIAKTNAAFSVPAAATAPTGVVGVALCATPTRKQTATAVDANGTTAAIIACGSAGISGATYVPVLTMTVPTGSLSGTYTGTVTQSVA